MVAHLAAALTVVFALAPFARAGGTPENAILIIDPTDATSMYVGNYYRNARNIPDTNVLYLRSASASYASFVATNQSAFIDTIAQRGLTDHADYAVLAPLDTFFVPASGLVSDGCSPVNRFSIASAYTLAPSSGLILAGGNTSQLGNTFFTTSSTPIAFDAEQPYEFGQPSTSTTARRSFIGALLGFTSSSVVSPNTVSALLTMIDRSVLADGARPTGTFYYMNNTADGFRNVRACLALSCPTPTRYNASSATINAVAGAGRTAQVLAGILPPTNTADCLGIMTGNATLDFAGANLTLARGAFGDHLTSWAATFDINDQTKVSAWIAAGASGTAGTVEEPCNYPGKFPSSQFHVFYAQGMSLGESYLRSMEYAPFQSLLYGDPLTRPFAFLPSVSVTNAPVGNVNGTIPLTPSASTANTSASIASYDLLVDGVRTSTVPFGQSFALDTRTLSDGRHDLRVLARDNSAVQSTGRWIGSLDTLNYGHSASLSVLPASGGLDQLFTFTFAASTGVREVRLVQNGRVLAASASPSGTLSVYGQNLGAGISQVRIEAAFSDNRLARSVPVSVSVAPTGASTAQTPVAFNLTRNLLTPGSTYVVELPASFNTDPASATYTLLSTPVQSTLVQSGQTGPYRLLRANTGATGSEQVQFRVNTSGGQSNIATLTLVYTLPPVCRADFNGVNGVEVNDIFAFLAAWFARQPWADFNGVNGIEVNDIFAFLSAWFARCP